MKNMSYYLDILFSRRRGLVTMLTLLLPAIAVLNGCDDGVLSFPDPDPAQVCVVNVTDDVDTLGVVVAATDSTTAVRGAVSGWLQCPAGRPTGFVLKNNQQQLRDTAYYTLGGKARVILFAYGSTKNVVEFRRAIQDTVLLATENPVIRFTHMAQNVDKFATVEVWIKDGPRLLPEDFDPGLSSNFASLPPGTYTFEIREYQSTNIAAILPNVTLERGKSYMLYTWDASAEQTDNVMLSIF